MSGLMHNIFGQCILYLSGTYLKAVEPLLQVTVPRLFDLYGICCIFRIHFEKSIAHIVS